MNPTFIWNTALLYRFWSPDVPTASIPNANVKSNVLWPGELAVEDRDS